VQLDQDRHTHAPPGFHSRVPPALPQQSFHASIPHTDRNTNHSNTGSPRSQSGPLLNSSCQILIHTHAAYVHPCSESKSVVNQLHTWLAWELWRSPVTNHSCTQFETAASS